MSRIPEEDLELLWMNGQFAKPDTLVMWAVRARLYWLYLEYRILHLCDLYCCPVPYITTGAPGSPGIFLSYPTIYYTIVYITLIPNIATTQ